MAGIEDCYTASRGSTRTLGNFVKATFYALAATYSFLTPELWRETVFVKSPLQEYSGAWGGTAVPLPCPPCVLDWRAHIESQPIPRHMRRHLPHPVTSLCCYCCRLPVEACGRQGLLSSSGSTALQGRAASRPCLAAAAAPDGRQLVVGWAPCILATL